MFVKMKVDFQTLSRLVVTCKLKLEVPTGEFKSCVVKQSLNLDSDYPNRICTNIKKSKLI